MMLANVIFPAPSAAYLVNLFFPVSAVLALAAEFAVFQHFQRGVMARWRLLAVVIGVNLFSWTVGIVLSFLLPSGLVTDRATGVLTQGINWSPLAMAGFAWACFLSFCLEYGVLRVARKWLRFRRLALCVGLANVASYVIILAVVGIHLHFDWF